MGATQKSDMSPEAASRKAIEDYERLKTETENREQELVRINADKMQVSMALAMQKAVNSKRAQGSAPAGKRDAQPHAGESILKLSDENDALAKELEAKRAQILAYASQFAKAGGA